MLLNKSHPGSSRSNNQWHNYLINPGPNYKPLQITPDYTRNYSQTTRNNQGHNHNPLHRSCNHIHIDMPHLKNHYRSQKNDMCYLNCNSHLLMRFCQSRNRLTCTHHRRYRFQFCLMCTASLLTSLKSQHLRYQDFICICFILHHRCHLLAFAQYSPHFRRSNRQDHIHILGHYRHHRMLHHPRSHLVILLALSSVDSHYFLQQSTYWVDLQG